MMKPMFCGLAFILFSTLSCATSPTPSTDRKGETQRFPQLENDEVQVWKKGNAYYYGPDKAGELHKDINESDHPMEVMVIQFKKPAI